ncbi:hypothetical protein EJ08DRAFT_680001 [Tothia fuscella]|uniref:Uncharacterized protein n=1 Tax=Tothia fuscella TaxID=1048955 RepID=A0A9P4NP38_9PEZI|nr:hypothetical protein EJ08DRAFT_680001 [Tothia fuscella]
MSNVAVGPVYAQIIEKIAAVAINDFEEAGLEQSTLQELKEQWQHNLSEMHVAQCPWDPPPPQQQMANPPTVPSNVKSEPQQHQHHAPPHQQQQQQQVRNGVALGEHHIKQEIKYEPGISSYAPAYGHGVGRQGAAQQRASHLLQQQFGSQAHASIQATGLPQQQPRPGQQQRPSHIQMPGNPHTQQQQRPQQPPPQQQPQYPQQHSSLSAAQTDGADDGMAEWSTILAERRARDEQDRAAADGMLRAHMERSAAFMDSGLMMPLSERPSKKGKSRTSTGLSFAPVPAVAQSSKSYRIPQVDGGDDDDDDEDQKVKVEDEDAINSDLDDSEDELDNPDADDQDGPLGETILCTYDKVQRVKNKGPVQKWKCVLKDGILTTGGREYVFHKATGEFEW